MVRSGPINVAFGIDERYVPQLAVVLGSIEARVGAREVRFFVIHDGIGAEARDRLSALHRGLVWLDASGEGLQALGVHHAFLSRAAYLRLLIPDLVPRDLQRIIYLDVDLILQDDIARLWEADLAGRPLGAVVDAGRDAAAFASEHGLQAGGRYFNSGMLVIDLDRMRESGLMARAFALAQANTYAFEDQDALNICFWGDWHELHPRWNFQRNFLYDDLVVWRRATADPLGASIIHYTDAVKPWSSQEWHPLAWVYLRELRRTPFGRDLLARGGITLATQAKWFLRWLLWTRRRVGGWGAA
jgi:lipopolysaccharide biosynthesis glycosyltransferase